MGIEAKTNQYWIAPNAVTITLNALGNPNRTQGSVASGAVISCYVEEVKPESVGPEYAGNGDGLGLDNGRNPKRWPLSLSPTYFNSNTAKYVYVAIPRKASVGTQAVVVFPSEHLDIYGKNAEGAQIGSTDYFYVWLQGIISATDGNVNRTWTAKNDFGSLGTYEDIMDMSETDWYQYSKVTGIVTFLKDIVMKAGTTFRNLILNNKELTGVATAATGDEFIDSETLVVTPSYINAKINNRFIRKDQDDETPYSLGVGQNLTVGGDAEFRNNLTVRNILRAVTGYFQSLYTSVIQSENYSGDGIADTGFRLTNDDGTGSSALTVDNLHVRKKATFEELEIKKETAVSGNEIRSAAANVIDRTDYYDSNDNLLGYSYTKVPWLLRKMPFLIRKGSSVQFFGRLRRVRMALSSQDAASIDYIRCYFLAKDGDREVKNLWKADAQNGKDLIRCQTFNLNRSKRYTYIDGQGEKVGNVYWWRKAKSVSSTTVNIDGSEYHYVDVYMNDCDAGSDIPTAGDHMVQFGNDSNPDRMNLIIQEIVEGDAPAIKAYMGIYTYDMNKCWWGGSPRKMMLSPKSGYEFYGPSFKYVQEYGVKRASIDRGLWSEITPERDDKAPHANIRKCYYYDKVSHNGCYWLCVMSNDGAHWVDGSGNELTQAQYDALTPAQKLLCSRKENYTTDEPSTTSSAWQKQVDRGTSVKSVTSKYAKQTSSQYNGTPPTSGWQDTIAAVGTLNEGDYLWTKNTTTYSDTLQDTVTYTVSKWGIDGDGIANIETKFYEDANMLTQAQLDALAENKWKDTYSGLALNQGDYIYTRTKITYDKGDTPTVSYTINRIADDGVSYVTTEEYYCLGTSNTTPPAKNPYTRNDGKPESMTPATMAARMAGGSWSESRPDYDTSTAQSRAKKYLWNFEVCYDTTANVQVTQPICIGNYEKGISTIVETYAISAYDKAPSGRDYPTDIQASDWTDEAHDHAPTDAKPYQWNRTVTTYSDGSSDTFYHVSGTKGTHGTNVTYDSEHSSVKYAVSAYGTPGAGRDYPSDITSWSTTMPTAQKGKYLWTQDITAYNDGGTLVYTTTYGVSYWGTDGSSITIDSSKTKTEYAVSTQGTNSSLVTGWSSSIPTVPQGQYLWTKVTTAYSDDKSTVAYSVSYNSTDGEDVKIDTARTFVKYAKQASSQFDGNPPADSSFGNFPSSLSQGDYLWTLSQVAYVGDSNVYKSYSVSRMGTDGTNGTPGVNGKTTHFAYAKMKAGQTIPSTGKITTSMVDQWSRSNFAGADAIGTYDDQTIADSTNIADYTWTEWKGEDGSGVEIDTTRTFIKYCKQSASDYTGIHPNDNQFSTTYPSNLGQGDYLWILNQVAYVGVTDALKSYSVSMLGTDGEDGDPGADGFTTHFAYATSADGSQNFSTTNFNGATYIGTYRDDNATDSTNYRDYTWTEWKGADGTSPYFADIDNEMDSVACDKDGKVTAAYSKTIGVSLWHGSSEMTLTDIVISGTTAAVTATKNVANKTITVSVANGTTIPLATELTITPKATGAPNDQSVHFVLNGIRPGQQGPAAVNVVVTPASMIVEQSLSNKNNIAPAAGNNLGQFTIQVLKGTTACTITSISATASQVYISESASAGTYTSRTWQPNRTDASMYLKGVGNSNGAYYDNGQITISITYTDPASSTSKTVSNIIVKVYVNLLGTWKDKVENDTKTEIATSINYLYDPQNPNQVVKNDTSYQSVKSSAESAETWHQAKSSTYDGYQTQIDNTNTRVSDAVSSISTISSRTSVNLFDCADGEGWREYSDDSLSTYDTSIQKVSSNDTYSTAVYLTKDITYVLSFYCNVEPSVMPCYCGGNPELLASDGEPLDELDIDEMSETYKGRNRHKGKFTPSISGYYKFDIYDDFMAYIYRPQIEVGNTPTAWVPGGKNFTSQIKQTANEISLTTQNTVEGKLVETGINIKGSTREINLIAGKVNFKANDGSAANPYMSIGSDGKLTVDSIQATNGNFSGTVRATNFFRSVCYVADGGTYSTGGNDTGNADLIILTGNGSQSWQDTDGVVIPTPDKYEGKTIEIKHQASGSNATITTEEDTTMYFARGIYYHNGSFRASTTTTNVTLNAGKSMRLQSVYVENKWRWLDITDY